VREVKKVIFYLLFELAALYLCACAALFFFQRSLLYFPQPRQVDTPESTMHMAVDDADLVVTVRLRPGPKALIYFGGNADDVSRSLDDFALEFPDYSLYLLHYRTYGGSSGKLSEEANNRDALALYAKVAELHDDITVMGRSLGSGVAIRLASEKPVRHLILVTPYDSIENIAAARYWMFPVRWLILDRYESTRYAPLVNAPTLILAAEHDTVIPRASSNNLYRHFKDGVASMIVVSDVGHNDIETNSSYMKAIHAALR
jgi:pimeloyl-ACP methyl ester carboxylesterase